MVDFAKLLDQKWIKDGKDPKVERARIKAAHDEEHKNDVRVDGIWLDMQTRASEKIELPAPRKFTLYPKDSDGRKIIAMRDGSTGYESFYWHELYEQMMKNENPAVYFCAGTFGRWNGCYVFKKEVLRAAKIWGWIT